MESMVALQAGFLSLKPAVPDGRTRLVHSSDVH